MSEAKQQKTKYHSNG